MTVAPMGFDVKLINDAELNFVYKDAILKYCPCTAWASGKTIKDGRGLNNLINQLET